MGQVIYSFLLCVCVCVCVCMCVCVCVWFDLFISGMNISFTSSHKYIIHMFMSEMNIYDINIHTHRKGGGGFSIKYNIHIYFFSKNTI